MHTYRRSTYPNVHMNPSSRNGLASNLQRALAVWNSRHALRNYKKKSEIIRSNKYNCDSIPSKTSSVFPKNGINHHHFSNDQKPMYSTLKCPSQICSCEGYNSHFDDRSFSLQLSSCKSNFECDIENRLNDRKEIKVMIASTTSLYEQLPKNAAFAYILDDNSQTIVPHHESKNVLGTDIVNSNCELSNFQELDHQCSVLPPSVILPCKHLVILFFILQLRKPPSLGEIFKILPPW